MTGRRRAQNASPEAGVEIRRLVAVIEGLTVVPMPLAARFSFHQPRVLQNGTVREVSRDS